MKISKKKCLPINHLQENRVEDTATRIGMLIPGFGNA